MQPEILEDLEDRFAAGHTALLIIDMQKEFVYDGFLSARAGRSLEATRSIIPNLLKLLTAARASGATVAHIGFETYPDHGSDTAAWLAQRRRATFSVDTMCVTGTEGMDFIDELAPEGDELRIYKHRYSAFKGTDLDMVLRARGIKSCVVTGVSTNVCVESTFRDAFETGYYVAVPPDATASWDMSLAEGTLKTVNHRFGVTPTTDEMVDIWSGSARAAAE